MKRVLAITAVAAAVGAGFATPASAAAVGCPNGWYERGTGVISPLSHREIRYCYPILP